MGRRIAQLRAWPKLGTQGDGALRCWRPPDIDPCVDSLASGDLRAGARIARPEQAQPNARVGSAAVDERRRRPLQPFVNTATAFIRSRGGDASLSDLGTHLRRRPGFMIAVRESGISQRAVIANFLRLFPRKFVVTIAPVGGVSTVRVA